MKNEVNMRTFIDSQNELNHVRKELEDISYAYKILDQPNLSERVGKLAETISDSEHFMTYLLNQVKQKQLVIKGEVIHD